MALSEAHIRKRRYQPSITSFFHNETQQPRPSLSPSLTPEVQASLLSVGMRVRKSVPEGYKTHKTLSIATLPRSSSGLPSSAASARPLLHKDTSRELVPFCGLFKTGALAAQQSYLSSTSADLQLEGAQEQDREYEWDECGEASVPGLSWSQSTAQSLPDNSSLSTCSKAAPRKRAYEDDAEAELDVFFDEGHFADDADSTQHVAARQIVKLKPSSQAQRHSGLTHVSDADDFGEAAFLAPMEIDHT